MSQQEALHKLWTRFILALKMQHPFFASIALYATCKLDSTVDIAQINDKEIIISPDFLEPMDEPSRFSYLLHQILHQALQHPYRGKNRNNELWNIAADIVVNNIINETTSWPIAPKTAWDFRYREDSVERVYIKLQQQKERQSKPIKKEGGNKEANKEESKKQNKEQSEGQNKEQSKGGNKKQNKGQSEEQNKEGNEKQNKRQSSKAMTDSGKVQKKSSQSLSKKYNSHSDFQTKITKNTKKTQQYWRSAMVKARQQPLKQHYGKESMSLQRELDLAIGQQLDWRRLLWKYATPEANDYEEFDPRFIHRNLYLEILRTDELNADVLIDTSGSISEKLLKQFLQELLAIHACHPAVHINIYYIDTEIHGPYDIPSDLSHFPVPIGGGGTSFKPYFEQLESKAELLNKTKVIVYFTDGFGDFPDKEPNIPVLWVVSEDGAFDENFPFGIITRIKE